VGDIDGNGDLEIVVTVRNTGHVFALHHDNTQMWVRFLNTNLFFNPSPALADLTGDGKLEAVVTASNGKIFAVQYNGADAPGWPVTYSTTTYAESSPIVADVNGDGVVDVLQGDEGKFINAWSATGVAIDGFPLVMKDSVRGTPTVIDLDHDGDVEVVAVGYDRNVYVWTLNAPYDATRAPWPTFHANVHRNGLYGNGFVTPVSDRPLPTSLALGANYPNPFNPSTTIAYEIPSATTRASLVVYDVRGARVRTLFEGTAKPGRHLVAWDGRNDAHDPVASGVYFYRLSTPARSLTRKMVLLK
jgi:hypothetical protein